MANTKMRHSIHHLHKVIYQSANLIHIHIYDGFQEMRNCESDNSFIDTSKIPQRFNKNKTELSHYISYILTSQSSYELPASRLKEKKCIKL